MNDRIRFIGYGWVAAIIFLVAPTPSILADSGANHQIRNPHFGVSGGNVKDISSAFCCSGTLGSLVQDTKSNQYVLSNNHVLSRTGQASAGEDISQPGRIDNGCLLPPVVADFTVAPPLGSNVDAAIALLRAGTMDSTGIIEDIGTISSAVKSPAPGLAVAKSGRTTGFTTGSIASINTSVNVQYQRGCGQGKKFVVAYTNQVVIQSSSFSAGGDSGSLIVTKDACPQPVALLFAGSSTTTVANPIGDVLTRVGAQLSEEKRPLTFVGNACGIAGALSSSTEGQTGALSQAAVDHATEIMQQYGENFMGRPGVIGVGIGASETDPTEAVIVIYVDQTARRLPRLPQIIQDIKVKVIVTDPIVAY